MSDPLDLKAVRRRCHLARASGTVSLDIPLVLALCDEVERLREPDQRSDPTVTIKGGTLAAGSTLHIDTTADLPLQDTTVEEGAVLDINHHRAQEVEG